MRNPVSILPARLEPRSPAAVALRRGGEARNPERLDRFRHARKTRVAATHSAVPTPPRRARNHAHIGNFVVARSRIGEKVRALCAFSIVRCRNLPPAPPLVIHSVPRPSTLTSDPRRAHADSPPHQSQNCLRARGNFIAMPEIKCVTQISSRTSHVETRPNPTSPRATIVLRRTSPRRPRTRAKRARAKIFFPQLLTV